MQKLVLQYLVIALVFNKFNIACLGFVSYSQKKMYNYFWNYLFLCNISHLRHFKFKIQMEVFVITEFKVICAYGKVLQSFLHALKSIYKYKQSQNKQKEINLNCKQKQSLYVSKKTCKN